MYAIRQEVLPASGVEFCASLNLTPSTLAHLPLPTDNDIEGVRDSNSSTSIRHAIASRALFNLVVARSNILRIFEVREHPAPVSAEVEAEGERSGKERKGTEAVEGEVEMDDGGEGYVNVGEIKSAQPNGQPLTVTRFHLLREYRLHGTVTGLERVRTLSSIDDNLDRLLVSFRDAKIALLEWSDESHDLLTVSMHTYERAPQLLALDSNLFRARLRVDPISRCAVLSLPNDALAVLPFYQTQVELDAMDQDPSRIREVPYAPSYVLDLSAEVDSRIRNVLDFVFLPGFNNPTLAILFQPQQTWTGRLTEYKDTFKLFIITLDPLTRSYPVITGVEGLPYDCLSLLACPASVGGVLVLTANALLYIDRSSRRLALPLNGWPARTSEGAFAPPPREHEDRMLALEGARMAFGGDERTVLLVLRDGAVHTLELTLEGRVVVGFTLGDAVVRTAVPAVVSNVGKEHVFIGSTVGESALLKTVRVEEEVVDEVAPVAAAVEEDMELDDEDEEIYGTTKPAKAPGANGVAAKPTITRIVSTVQLSLCDSIPGHGPITDMAFAIAKNGDRLVPELIAATGSGPQSGFTLFQRDLPSRIKRKLHVVGGGRGMWSLPIRQRATDPFQAEHDSVIVSTDVNPSPGLSRIANRSSKADVTITTRVPGTTVTAGSFFQRTAILQVMTNSIRLLEPDGAERQMIKDVDGNMTRPKIRYANVCDPYIMVIREDDTLGLFVGAFERGKIRRKDMSPMGDKTSRYLAGCFYADTSGVFQTRTTTAGTANGTDNAAMSTVQSIVNVDTRSQWLFLVRPEGVLEIWTLPKLALVFSTPLAASLQPILTDSLDGPTPSLPQDPPRKPQDLDIDQILVAPLGETSAQPHLFVFLRSGHLVVYEICPAAYTADAEASARTTILLVKFVKSASRTFEIQRPEEGGKTILAEQKRVQRLLIPFTTSPTESTTLSGVFFTGDRPCWILATDKGGVQIHPSGHAVVHAFTACSLWESKGDFLMYTDEGPCLLEWMPDVDVGTPLPSRHIPRPRPYSNVAFDPSTGLIVASAVLQAQFASYDEDGNILWEPDASNIGYPTCDCSTLELISPDGWVTMDGHEFGPNEFVNAIEFVTLETQSNETGFKEFVAVATTVDRGEDLAVRGATYIFDVVEVVADSTRLPKRWYKLRLCCKDEAKGPVTALCGMNGYLVSSMGQKMYVRAFDLDERLVGVAFLDVGVYVTSLRAVKNLVVVGDAVKSVWFLAFQEDPYKLVVLAKDVHRHCVTNADFFFNDKEVSIITGDEDGVVRVYTYDPRDPDSKNGQELICRTEFHGQVEYRASVTIARRTADDLVLPQSKLLCGSADGSLSTLTAVDEAAFKRLQLLQGQLTGKVQHVAGLNPRAFRIVRNDHVSRPLARGILDGNLLTAFAELPVPRQDEFTRQIGTDRETVLKDWNGLVGVW